MDSCLHNQSYSSIFHDMFFTKVPICTNSPTKVTPARKRVKINFQFFGRIPLTVQHQNCLTLTCTLFEEENKFSNYCCHWLYFVVVSLFEQVFDTKYLGRYNWRDQTDQTEERA